MLCYVVYKVVLSAGEPPSTMRRSICPWSWH